MVPDTKAVMLPEHTLPSPLRHSGQWPQGIIQVPTTWSPTFTRVTPGPIASTTPAHSWPATIGRAIWILPIMLLRSLWQ